MELIHDIVQVRPADLGDGLGVGNVLGKGGTDDILLIDACQRNEGVHVFQSLLQKEALVRSVSVDDLRLREGLGKGLAALLIQLDHPHLLFISQKHLRQIIGNGAASRDQTGVRRCAPCAQGLQEVFQLGHGNDHRDLVSLPEDKVTGGDDHLSIPLHGTYQDAVACLGTDVLQAPARQAVMCLQLQGEDGYPAVGKHIDPA